VDVTMETLKRSNQSFIGVLPIGSAVMGIFTRNAHRFAMQVIR